MLEPEITTDKMCKTLVDIIIFLEKSMKPPCICDDISYKTQILPFYEDFMKPIRQNNSNTGYKTINEVCNAIINFTNSIDYKTINKGYNAIINFINNMEKKYARSNND